MNSLASARYSLAVNFLSFCYLFSNNTGRCNKLLVAVGVVFLAFDNTHIFDGSSLVSYVLCTTNQLVRQESRLAHVNSCKRMIS